MLILWVRECHVSEDVLVNIRILHWFFPGLFTLWQPFSTFKLHHVPLSRDGLQPLDYDVGKWMRKHASGIRTILVMNKSESLDEKGLLAAASGEAYGLGFGDPIAMSAETGLGMVELYETLQPLFEEYVHQLPKGMLFWSWYYFFLLQKTWHLGECFLASLSWLASNFVVVAFLCAMFQSLPFYLVLP